MTVVEAERPIPGIFVSGRNHSGNTVLSLIFGRVPTCLAQIDENAFFEHRLIVDKLDAPTRADRVFQLLRLEQKTAQEPTRLHLHRLANERPHVSALDLYREGMTFAARLGGRRFWVQKATSYIFYGQEILTSMPDARLIYLVRNPYDIAASRKRRHRNRERVWSTMVGWNKGMRIAQALMVAFPDRLRAVRYEDLTGQPEETVGALLQWIGEPFDSTYLDVPHVNQSETRYSLTGSGKGLNRSRVNYYVDNLSRIEIAALDLLADRSLLDPYYPDLPHRLRRMGVSSRIAGAALAASGPVRYGYDYLRRLWRQPSLLIARTARRLR